MGGYVLLTVFSVLVIFLTPFCAFFMKNTPKTEPLQTPVADTVHVEQNDDAFKVQNVETGDILTLQTKDFIIGIVSCEMSAGAPVEALKAQAVAAYTYYCKQRSAAENGVFSNVPETFFTHGTKDGMQARWGDAFEKNYQAISDAVQAVLGKQIVYENQPITACYHAISAGLTERATDVWGGEYPYLVPVDSFGDLQASGYETTAAFTPQELTALLQKCNADFQSADDPAQWFSAPDTTDSGFVKTINICKTAFKGTDIRTALSLRSACFTVAYKEEKFQFTVHGYGHNVGMSQTGAMYMANLGADYREILAHYYPNTTII